MNVAHLFILLKETHMSPEDLAERLGLSGMTLRRWRTKDLKKPLPEMYKRAFIGTVYDLILENKLSSDSDSAKIAFKMDARKPLSVCLKELGLSAEFLKSQGENPERLTEVLAKIGEAPERLLKILQRIKDFDRFLEMSSDWGPRVQLLLDVVKSKRIMHFERAVAIGALFYLLMPLDLIPDHIPFFGYMDDFSFINAATMFYRSRYKTIFN